VVVEDQEAPVHVCGFQSDIASESKVKHKYSLGAHHENFDGRKMTFVNREPLYKP
jgi:hypothetical protein